MTYPVIELTQSGTMFRCPWCDHLFWEWHLKSEARERRCSLYRDGSAIRHRCRVRNIRDPRIRERLARQLLGEEPSEDEVASVREDDLRTVWGPDYARLQYLAYLVSTGRIQSYGHSYAGGTR